MASDDVYLTDAEWKKLLREATKEGKSAGKSAATWAEFDSKEQAKDVVRGIMDIDPEVMDRLPFLDLSGQWADGPREADILEDICGSFCDAESLDPEEADDLINAYRDAYDTAVHDEVLKAARRAAR